MENAINFVRGEAEKHFSNSLNCRLFRALSYHTSQKYHRGAAGVHFNRERLNRSRRGRDAETSADGRRKNLKSLLFKRTETSRRWLRESTTPGVLRSFWSPNEGQAPPQTRPQRSACGTVPGCLPERCSDTHGQVPAIYEDLHYLLDWAKHNDIRSGTLRQH